MFCSVAYSAAEGNRQEDLPAVSRQGHEVLHWSVKQDMNFCSAFLTVLAAALAQTLPNNAQAWERSPSTAWTWPSGAVEGCNRADMGRGALDGLQDMG